MIRTAIERAAYNNNLFSIRNIVVRKRMKPSERELTQPVSGNRSIYGIINQLGEVDKEKNVDKPKRYGTAISKGAFLMRKRSFSYLISFKR